MAGILTGKAIIGERAKATGLIRTLAGDFTDSPTGVCKTETIPGDGGFCQSTGIRCFKKDGAVHQLPDPWCDSDSQGAVSYCAGIHQKGTSADKQCASGSVCGDGNCQSPNENWETCRLDCKLNSAHPEYPNGDDPNSNSINRVPANSNGFPPGQFIPPIGGLPGGNYNSGERKPTAEPVVDTTPHNNGFIVIKGSVKKYGEEFQAVQKIKLIDLKDVSGQSFSTFLIRNQEKASIPVITNKILPNYYYEMDRAIIIGFDGKINQQLFQADFAFAAITDADPSKATHSIYNIPICFLPYTDITPIPTQPDNKTIEEYCINNGLAYTGDIDYDNDLINKPTSETTTPTTEKVYGYYTFTVNINDGSGYTNPTYSYIPSNNNNLNGFFYAQTSPTSGNNPIPSNYVSYLGTSPSNFTFSGPISLINTLIFKTNSSWLPDKLLILVPEIKSIRVNSRDIIINPLNSYDQPNQSGISVEPCISSDASLAGDDIKQLCTSQGISIRELIINTGPPTNWTDLSAATPGGGTTGITPPVIETNRPIKISLKANPDPVGWAGNFPGNVDYMIAYVYNLKYDGKTYNCIPERPNNRFPGGIDLHELRSYPTATGSCQTPETFVVNPGRVMDLSFNVRAEIWNNPIIGIDDVAKECPSQILHKVFGKQEKLPSDIYLEIDAKYTNNFLVDRSCSIDTTKAAFR